MRILVVDFDGVIHSYTSGWKGVDVVADGPVEGAIRFLQEAASVFDVAVFSARSSEVTGREAMRAALAEWSASELGGRAGAELVAKLSFPEHKPAGFVGIDDRVLTFTGEWPDLSTLESFQPWNKRVLPLVERDRNKLLRAACLPVAVVCEKETRNFTYDPASGSVSCRVPSGSTLAQICWTGAYVIVEAPEGERLGRIVGMSDRSDAGVLIRISVPVHAD